MIPSYSIVSPSGKARCRECDSIINKSEKNAIKYYPTHFMPHGARYLHVYCAKKMLREALIIIKNKLLEKTKKESDKND